MRIHLKTTANTKLVPFNYHRSLVGAFHKWLGQNQEHDALSLYSLSWLQGGKLEGEGFNFSEGASWRISSPNEDLLKELIFGIQKDPKINFGLEVKEILLQSDPIFSKESRFLVGSPVLVKRINTDNNIKYFLYHDKEVDALMTETMKNKLSKIGKDDLELSVAFDRKFSNPHTKMIDYNGIKIKGSICPIIIKGDPEAIAFAWNVGVGNSTGIGFGSLK